MIARRARELEVKCRDFVKNYESEEMQNNDPTGRPVMSKDDADKTVWTKKLSLYYVRPWRLMMTCDDS